METYDFSASAVINIDTVMDAVVKSRNDAGIGGVPEEAVIDESTGRRYRRFQKRSDKEEADYQDLKKAQQVNEEHSFLSSGYNINPLAARGLKVYDRLMNIDDDDYDNAPTYICPYCSKLSRAKKYTPVTCDNCSECLSCNQFAKKECSGCEYSRWREGVPYSQVIGETNVVDHEDMVIINDVMNRCQDDDDSSGFKDLNITSWSVLDY